VKFLYIYGIPVLQLCYCQAAFSQQFDDNFFKENALKTSYAIDKEADAIVLYEKIDVVINREGYGNMEQYTVHKIIKNLKPSTSLHNIADVKISYPNSDHFFANISNLKGTTYNMGGGVLIKSELSKKDILETKINKGFSERVFAMPQVKEGSVIDYEYTLRFNGIFSLLPTWEIQEKYPKLKTEYGLTCPSNLTFSIIWQGLIPFSDYKSEAEAAQNNALAYRIYSESIDELHVRWVEKDIFAIKNEPYLSCIENFVARQDIQISGNVVNPFYNRRMVTTWEEMDASLLRENNFGKIIDEPDRFLNDAMDSLVQPGETPIAKAKAIFNFTRSNFNCRNYSALYCSNDDIKKTFKNRSGNDADINLLLLKMLRKAGLTAYPLVMTKRGDIRATEKYPILGRLNYVVCVLQIDSDAYFLDATDKYMPFGVLPEYCYNGYARLVAPVGSGENLSTEDVKENNIFYFNIYWQNDSLVKIEVNEKMGKYRAMAFRKEWAKDDKKVKEYAQKESAVLKGDVSISDIQVSHLNEPDTDLLLNYTIEMKFNKNNKLYYFNANLVKFFEENPFKSAHRYLPIEFPFQTYDSYTVHMKVPKFYKPEELPPPALITYGDGDMKFKFLTEYNAASGVLSVNKTLAINSTTYSSGSYEDIRSFFEKMNKEENNIITFNKITE